jgi:tRNA(Ile)-lysidine synthase
MHGAPARPITAAEFARAMARFAPFERRPVLAVAVSGGGDSLALVHLAEQWARRRNGRAIALIVDHGLRRESAREARRAAGQLRERGIAAKIIAWRGSKPAANRQAKAREARYRLLEESCRSRGILHLLVAHHADDQAETLLLRLQRGSGLDGLSGMAAEVERAHVRVLRPLLGFAKASLEATAARAGFVVADDPSNRDRAHARSRVRAAVAALELDPKRMADAAAHLGRARQALGEAVGDLLGRAVEAAGAPILRIDIRPILAAPEEIGLRALARILAAVGGADVTARFASLHDLYRDLTRIAAGGGGRTLGGCLIRGRRGVIEVSPEKGPKNLKDRPEGLALWGSAFAVV